MAIPGQPESFSCTAVEKAARGKEVRAESTGTPVAIGTPITPVGVAKVPKVISGAPVGASAAPKVILGASVGVATAPKVIPGTPAGVATRHEVIPAALVETSIRPNVISGISVGVATRIEVIPGSSTGTSATPKEIPAAPDGIIALLIEAATGIMDFLAVLTAIKKVFAGIP